MNKKVLVVDDETNVLSGYSRNLGEKFQLTCTTDPAEALRLMGTDDYAAILSDLRMPGMNGIELLKAAKEKQPDVVRMIVSGNADLQSMVEAINDGSIFRILLKPCHHSVLEIVLEDAVRQHQLIISEKQLLNQTLNGSIQVIVDILSIVDPESFGKASLRREIAKTIALEMKLPHIWDIEIAALLYDIGHVTLPPELIRKNKWGEPINSFERDLIAQLPEMSAKLLSNIPRLEEVSRIVRYQNKDFDGKGFPQENISGQEIPIGSRILTAVNAFLTIKQEEISTEKALEKLDTGTGRYDPEVIQVLKKSCGKIKNISTNQTSSSISSVMVKDLVLGQTLCSDIVSDTGFVVMGAGLKLQMAHIQKIHNFSKIMKIREPIDVFEI